jgi:hypothetical protein
MQLTLEKSYSRRCLDRASQIYRSTPWTAAQDRIEYSLGRQAYTLGESEVAVEHFLRLLRREDTGVPGSQAMVLADMSLAFEVCRAFSKQRRLTSTATKDTSRGAGLVLQRAPPSDTGL